ncbi:uncharacterized protein AMSG_08122 [Thecamonas trahens ATCC 50062]|uniref:DEP domain-containing protein n=1 Tax=Thecamonas trahens ATCC 50062 TaxID=461836 RepID=A0A0L0DK01_THETB|nr:hypothetical protein AMSG_08122 [Thecamonas trahens ATCC 50062]KNC52555.1 hypothetical protein AMSG_08122 [Thecamonas trahens ATCC 50062]|eukprot:XP_013755345.1 hypothetical protein AMSG_08122 [Thecamonas trahens ATCC 50062]
MASPSAAASSGVAVRRWTPPPVPVAEGLAGHDGGAGSAGDDDDGESVASAGCGQDGAELAELAELLRIEGDLAESVAVLLGRVPTSTVELVHGPWHDVVAGCELLDWLVENGPAALGWDDGTMWNRALAYKAACALAGAGCIVHASGRRRFADARYYYRLEPRALAKGIRQAAQSQDSPPVLGASELGALCARMADGGIELGSHSYHLTRYTDSFTGAEAASWLMAQLGCSRHNAQSVGAAMLRAGLIRHVNNAQLFSDQPSFVSPAVASASRGRRVYPCPYCAWKAFATAVSREAVLEHIALCRKVADQVLASHRPRTGSA